MTLIDLVVRWLRFRAAVVTNLRDGVHVDLAPGDSLAAIVGQRFVLAPIPAEALVPPGVEPVYPGSRIADLCAGDLEAVGGIAVVVAHPLANLGAPTFVFSFRAVFLAAHRSERLVRIALNEDGQEVAIPPEADPPLRVAGSIADWLEKVTALFPGAAEIARNQSLTVGAEVEREAQRSLYLAVRRLATFYRRYRDKAADADAIAAEYRRRIAEEVDRHRLRISVTLIGITVVLPSKLSSTRQ